MKPPRIKIVKQTRFLAGHQAAEHIMRRQLFDQESTREIGWIGGKDASGSTFLVDKSDGVFEVVSPAGIGADDVSDE